MNYGHLTPILPSFPIELARTPRAVLNNGSDFDSTLLVLSTMECFLYCHICHDPGIWVDVHVLGVKIMPICY
jgi:hypothetical protein